MPQNNNVKIWIAIVPVVLLIIGAGYNMVDTTEKIDDIKDSVSIAVDTHDNCATSHPDIRNHMERLANSQGSLKRSLDSLLIETRHMNKGIEDIKQLIKDGNGG